MSDYKFICLTGGDRIGKETQSTLLQLALTPSKRVSYPSYPSDNVEGHWSAEITRTILYEEVVFLQRTNGKPLFFRPTKQPPEVFQMLQAINRVDQQPALLEALKTQHIVGDRWAIDALIFGAVDGCNPDWLLAMDALYHPADLNFIFIGEPFPRPGEEPDINERDAAFQRRVREGYLHYADQHPETCVVLNIDDYHCEDAIASMMWVHRAVCGALWARLGLWVSPLTYDQIGERFPHLKP